MNSSVIELSLWSGVKLRGASQHGGAVNVFQQEEPSSRARQAKQSGVCNFPLLQLLPAAHPRSSPWA